MRHFYTLLGAVLLAGMVLIGYDYHLNQYIEENKEVVRDYRSYERFWSHDVLAESMDENTLVIFGSSELTSVEDPQNNISNFMNSADMNVLTVGGGSFQSLSHAMALGSIAEELPNKKVALFLSPQWFEETGVSKEAFPSRFSEDHLLQFLKNSDISNKNKEYVLNRTLSLLENSPAQYARVEKYKKGFDEKLGPSAIYTGIMHSFWELRSKYEFCKASRGKMRSEVPSVDLRNMDFAEMLKRAEEQGRAKCTNNDFGVYDEYWDTYVAARYKAGEVLDKNQKYTESVEYEDLRCFLRVAEEVGVEVLLVSIPVNEKWYSFQGILCDEYYENIRILVGEYSNVTLIDMTGYESEKYFFKDIMHLGWKGWTRISEALYREFKK